MKRQRIFAADPGFVTGWVLADASEDEEGRYHYLVDEWDELDWYRFLKRFEDLVSGPALHQPEVVVSERYHTPRSRATEQHDHPEINGALRWICRRFGIPFVLQNVSDATEYATDDRIVQLCRPRDPQAVGYRGAGHAKMAARHLVRYFENGDR